MGGGGWIPEVFEAVERAFWKELFDGTPGSVLKNIDLVQDAVILGTLSDAFFFEEANVGRGESALRALPKLKERGFGRDRLAGGGDRPRNQEQVRSLNSITP